MKQDRLLDCEKSYKERIKENYRENGVLYHFYLWLFKKKQKGGIRNMKGKKISFYYCPKCDSKFEIIKETNHENQISFSVNDWGNGIDKKPRDCCKDIFRKLSIATDKIIQDRKKK